MENHRVEKEKVSNPERPFRFSASTLASVKHPDRNEDMIYFPVSKRDALWAGVFDGLGGVTGGFFASHMAEEVFRWGMPRLGAEDPKEIENNLKEVFEKVSVTLSESKDVGETTAVVAKLLESHRKKQAVIASVGDSRAYLLRDGKITRITTDDSLFTPQLLENFEHVTSESELTEFEVHLFQKRRNIVTQSLGGAFGELEVHSYPVELKTGDFLVLTTDGVHDNLTRDEIRQAVTIEGDKAKNLVDMARKRSGEDHFRAHMDDMSAVVVEVK